MSQSRVLRLPRRRRWLRSLLLAPADRVDRAGTDFYNAGRSIGDMLKRLAAALRERDLAAVESFYHVEYRGGSLGLAPLHATPPPPPDSDRDGVRIYRLRAAAAEGGRQAAVDEWRDYLAGFADIEELALHVHLLESWDAAKGLVASIRFEAIGRTHGAPRAGIDRGYFRMRFAGGAADLEIVRGSLIEGERVVGDQPHFVDVAAAAGVDFENRWYPGFLDRPLKFGMIRYGPAGITAVDYDNDGWYDLFIPDGVESKLFRNRRDGTFEDVTERAGLAGLDGVSVAVFGDYDNDGCKDLFVSRTFRPNQLFHNNGDGTFTDVTARSGIGEDSCTTAASWADYDNDGLLDLYVGRYLDPRTEIPTTFYTRNGLPNQLYHNNGDGTFTNVTREAGVGEVGACLGTVFGDYDDDGYPDLYVVNDFGRNTLYRNNRDGTFSDVSKKTNTLAYGAGMSASFGDYDNDGRLDIYVANIRSEERWFGGWPTVKRYMLNSFRHGVWRTDLPLYLEILRQSGLAARGVFQQMGSGNTLLHNRGDGGFDDVSWRSSANPVGWFWGSSFADFDNDGWQEIYSANGWVYNDKDTEIELDFFSGIVSDQRRYKTGIFYDPRHFGNRSWHGWERNRHLRPDGAGGFTEIGRAAGTDLVLNSRGIAVADFWNRGVLDIAVAASTDRHALLRNEIGARRNWLAIEVLGGAGRLPDGTNRDGVGVRVSLVAGGLRLMREVVEGDGYGSQSSLRLYFGLGDAEQADEITVWWPRSRQRQTFRRLAVNRFYRLVEGDEGDEALAVVAFGGRPEAVR
jgi:ASPIC and UnbV/FG-GAP-like repeat